MAAPNIRTFTIDISVDDKQSAAVHMQPGLSPVALVPPATWTAASISFTASVNGVDFEGVFLSDKTEIKIAAADVQVGVPTALSDTQAKALRGWPILKIRSGVKGTEVAQEADRVFQVVCAEVQ